MRRLQLLLVLLFLGIVSQTFAQDREVTGRVIDEKRMPIPGASVYVKNTSIGTTTDFDGEFSLTVAEENATLVISYVGFLEKEIIIDNQDFQEIILSPNVERLDEVVVVGYGSQKRANLTGAVSTIDTEILEARPITDVASGLQGTTPGLTITSPSGRIGTSPSIKLRGNIGTLGTGGGAEPLILVDNVEIDNLNMVNPQDIESISVLKDAASTSIYGSRAAWGVVLITTKKGVRNTNPVVAYSNNFSWATPTETPELAPAAEGAEMSLAAVRRRIPGLPSYGIVGMYFDDLAIEKMREWEELYGDQDLGPEMVLGRDFEIRDGRLFFYRPWDAQELFVREWTPQVKHDLSVSGGSENTNYYLGLGYLGQEGVLAANPDQYDRYNLNLNVSSNITDWFEARANLLYSDTYRTYPIDANRTYDAWYYTTRWPRTYPYGTYEGHPFRNHISEVAQGTMTEESSALARLGLGATLTPLEGLEVNFDYTHDKMNEHIHEVGGTYYAYNFWATGPDLEYGPYSSASYDRVQYSSAWSLRNTAKVFATYENEIGDHSIKVMAGGDMVDYEYWYHSSQKRELMDPSMGEIDLATGDMFVNGARDQWATLGVFGRINYAYLEKFLFELNGRYDGSSKLSATDRWAFFPSGSVGYILTEENYMEFANPTLSFLKLRASYGSIGNQNSYMSNIYRIMSSYGSNWLIGGQEMVTAGTPGALPADLTWETVTTLDFGVDARFFSDKLSFTFDWYERTVSDMHTAGVTLPSTFGTGSPVRNFGELTTTGWESALSYRHLFDNGLNITFGATLSDFTEEITKFANTTMGINSFYEGKELGEIWGYETVGFFSEDDFNPDGTLVEGIPSQALYENSWFVYGPGDIRYADLDGDGVITYGANTVDDHGDLRVIGNTTPRYQYSFTLGADWKGFDLSAFMQGVGKRDMWANGPVVIPGYRYAEGWYAHQLDYWTPENTNAFYPRPTDQSQSNQIRNFMPQTKYLLDMSYLRMKNITFGYSLSENVIDRLGFNKFRIYFSGENLFEFTNLHVPVDPEIDLTPSGRNDPNTFGRVYPFRRSLSVGLQVSL
ncbi:SusC/RagA family TonB-linked outer membrane protein [Salinimicrobium terrae]|uniref:SusC/RagA family TonB-linked outer membrane protein n=1 Tax=Salinimicrobium terrae TaxID=470866 RepID=UPI00048CD0A6|nr:TonB-dependent receptor [Salinimicrobium terrae]